MHTRIRSAHPFLKLAIAASLAGLLLVAARPSHATLDEQNGPSTGSPKAFEVTSSLTGIKALPHRIHWLGRPSLRPEEIAEVDFLIDGRRAFVEHQAPYVYGRDGNWLVTSWLTPGRHRFGVRATATDGRRAAVSSVARVVPAPNPPATLAGNWQRQYSQDETGDAPAGLWKLSIDRTGWKIMDPARGGNYIDVAYLGSQLLETRGGIWTKPHPGEGQNVLEGNGWCEDTNAPVRFRWHVDGESATFAIAGPRRCDGLGDFLSKTWVRSR